MVFRGLRKPQVLNDTSSRSSRGDVERLNLALATGSHFAMVIDTYSHEHEVPQT